LRLTIIRATTLIPTVATLIKAKVTAKSSIAKQIVDAERSLEVERNLFEKRCGISHKDHVLLQLLVEKTHREIVDTRDEKEKEREKKRTEKKMKKQKDAKRPKSGDDGAKTNKKRKHVNV
jgi:predicted RND superfamily exporter protein